MSRFKCKIGLHVYDKSIPHGAYDTWCLCNRTIKVCRYCPVFKVVKEGK